MRFEIASNPPIDILVRMRSDIASSRHCSVSDKSGGFQTMKQIRATVILALLAISVFASGCVFVQSSAISDRTSAGAPLSASASDYGFVHLVAPSGLTQTAFSNLMSSCATGKITGVTTELGVRDFFIVQYYTVSVTGSCI
jgi:hypothetical protein